MDGASIMKGLFQSIENKCRVRGAAGAPCGHPKEICVQITQGNDAPGKDVNYESDIDEPVPSADIGEIVVHWA